jgi:two-component system chemotaxis response regulator CheY
MTEGAMTTGVIVADNDSAIRGVLRSMLAGVGQNVFVAATGEEAIAFAWNVQARLVVLDLNMPGLNGLLACERIRAMPGHAHTPIAILTAHDSEAARRAAERVGATLFVAKPFQPTSLLKALAPYLGLDAGTRDAVSTADQRARSIGMAAPQGQSSRFPAQPDEAMTGRPPNALDIGRNILAICRQTTAR